MRRSLIFFWARHLAVFAGAALATSILTGALLVGDSVRGSLRDQVHRRLGKIEAALTHSKDFRRQLAGDLEDLAGSGKQVVPMIRLRATAVADGSQARSSGIQLLGVDEGFADLFPHDEPPRLQRPAGQSLASVVINESLARELSTREGESLTLSFQGSESIPRETLLGRRELWQTRVRLSVQVSQVIPDQGLGGFGLEAQQKRTSTALIELSRLQRALGQGDRVNTLLSSSTAALAENLGQALELDDLGLLLRQTDAEVIIDSRGFFVNPSLANGITSWAQDRETLARPVLTYLALSLQVGEKSVPYSTVGALDTSDMKLKDGSRAGPLEDGEILLNQWAADDLGCQPGDLVRMRYFELARGDELVVAESDFRLAGIVELSGLGADPTLAPLIPGVTDALSITSWEPPFPVDFGAIKARDHDYWDRYRASPKAFVSLATGQRLWRSRYGEITSVRLLPGPGESPGELALDLALELPLHMDAASQGFQLREVKKQGLAAARGSTDFGQLFIGFSFFLIVSAALLLGLLIRLAVEQRAQEAGLLRAFGFAPLRVQRRFLLEHSLVAGLGSLAGVLGALFYAWLMLAGLRTLWLPAVGTPMLFLHVELGTLMVGWLASLMVVLFTSWRALGRLHKLPVARLLAGSFAAAWMEKRPRRHILVMALALVLALTQTGLALRAESSSPALAFGAGTSLLIAGLAAVAWAFSSGGTSGANALGPGSLLGMAIRNPGRTPGRSLLCIALVASASFIIVVVAASRSSGPADVTDKGCGSGGFTLMAESDIPLIQDLNQKESRLELGARAIFPFRVLPGEDASCLNLYRPARPRVLGVTPGMVARGGFQFSASSRPDPNPWSLLHEDLGPGVLPAIADEASARWILHLGLGDELELVDEMGSRVTLKLVALLRDSIFQGDLLVAEERLLSAFPAISGYSFFLAETGLQEADAVKNRLESRLGSYGFDVTSTAQRLQDLKAVANTYLSTFQTLGGLGLVLGTLGLGVILMRNTLERRGELAALRAMGFRRRSLAALFAAENGFLLILGLVIGAASALLAVIPNGGQSPPLLPLAITLSLVFAVGLLSSLGAVLLIARVPLLPVLKEDL